MTRFIAQLNDGSHINIHADEMRMEGPFVCAYQRGNLVAVLDVFTVPCAHLSDKAVTV